MTSVITAITDVFTKIGEWIATAIPALQPIFWNADANQLTFLGVLATCGLGFSVIFL